MELSEFDKQVADTIYQGKGMVGEGGETYEQLFVDLGIEPTEANQAKVKASLAKLISMRYVNKVDYGTNMPAQYNVAGRYELEKSAYWRGSKWGSQPLRESKERGNW